MATTVSRTVPDSGKVGQLGRDIRPLLDPNPAADERAEPLLVAHGNAFGSAISAPDHRHRSLVVDPVEGPVEPVEAPGDPLRAHPTDAIVVGRGAPQAQGRRSGEQWVDEQAGDIELDRSSTVDLRGLAGRG